MRNFLRLVMFFAAMQVHAGEPDTGAIVRGHIMPGYQALAEETGALAKTAVTHCGAHHPELIAAFHDAFDAWVRVSHLRFGPSEQKDRAFALAFWPDPRGSGPKAIADLIATRDRVVDDAGSFATVSIAARGFYALEHLLFDPQVLAGGAAGYRCALVKSVTTDISRNAAAILKDWQSGYGDLMSAPGNDTYRTSAEATRQLFTALTTGLEFTSQTRLGRPMGSFDRPRPGRAEARRSARSLRHVILSLNATKELALLMAEDEGEMTRAFDAAILRAETLKDPVFAGVADPQARLRIEVLQQSIDDIRQLLALQVGPALGISPGFNALDGD